jgi:hypothetical protein
VAKVDPNAQLNASGADADTTQPKRRRLGKHLVKHGIVSKKVVRSALEEQERTGYRLGEILVARGAIDSVTLVRALADQDLVETVSAEDRVVQALPISLAFEHRAVVLVDDAVGSGHPVRVAVTDLATVPAIWEALGRPIEPKLTDPQTMERLLSEAYPEYRDGVIVGSTPEPVAREEAGPPPVEDVPAQQAPATPETEDGDSPSSSGDGAATPTEPPLTNGVADGVAGEADSASAVPTASANGHATRSANGHPTGAADGQPAAAATRWEPPTPAPALIADSATTRPTPPPEARPRRLSRLFGRQTVAQPRTRGDAVGHAPAVIDGSAEGSPALNGGAPAEAPVEPELPRVTLIIGLRLASPATLNRLVALLQAIDYPRDRLEALAVHDPADRITRRALHDQPMPAWVTESVVPRTATPGPRGLLLWGLREAKGELLTVLSIADPFAPTLLRRVATGEDDAALASVAIHGPRGLTDAFLRHAEPHPLGAAGSPGAPREAGADVFRVAELRQAFGWPALIAQS